MLKSIINGGATTPTMLAKEIVFCHGEHAVVALPNILGAAGISATEREFALVSEMCYQTRCQLIDSNLFYDEVMAIEEGEAPTFDVAMPERVCLGA
ncbi:hypothetical protein H0O60_08535 [Escherichia coli]|nr:hypothetical protein [Escherichia coli]